MTSSSESIEIELRKKGDVNVWLMPLSLIGVVVVLGPLMAYGFHTMPGEWIHERTMELTAALTMASAVTLMLAYLGAKKVVDAQHRLLRVGPEHIGVYDVRGRRRYAEVPREDVEIQQRHWTIDGPSGRYVSPVLWLRSPGSDWLTVSVDDAAMRWADEVEECEHEADFQVTADRWASLVEALGLQERLERA